MQNQWRVIDCTDLDGSISYERGRMRVVKNDTGECVDVPLAQIAVVLLGLHVRCSAAVLHEMARYGVSVMLCDWRGVPDAALHAWTDMPTTVTTRQLAQSNMSLPRKKSAWARIVQMKIRGQAACLDSSKLEGGGLLRGIAASVRSGDPSNCEGHAAREYWRRMFPQDEKFRRIPGQGYGRNAQLDYAYMVLRGFAVKAVIAAGLIPSLGVNHHGRGNYFCLADDLLEVYRPAVDYRVSLLNDEDSLQEKAVKKHLVDAVNQQFNGSGLTIPSSLNDFAQQFGLYCEGKIDRLCLVMFDLPVKTKRQRHAATVFRNMLLDMGYGMVQYSVYVRYTPTQSGNRATVKMIKDNLPANGLVRILHISDHQWSTAARFSSGKREIEEETPDFLTLF